jgi:FAD/FMN-containing dehydrogenase
MGKIKSKDRAYLEKKFGNRVSFRRVERKLHGHDIAAMPSLIKPFIGSTTPEAVVQPETEQELAEVVRWASEKGIPLTPRGKASSGYGGVLPIKKGIVVDFFRMNKVMKVNKKAQTATVQAGVVWEKFERELKKKGLALRLYPSSYPGSTVGGWFAQGGAGFGSYEAGWFSDNVVGARVVLTDGTVRDFAGRDLKLIDGAEGITGFISELTIHVRPLEDLKIAAVACPDAHDLQRFVQALVDNKIPIWSLSFINPLMAELKNKAPLMEHHGRPAEERVLLPAAYVITLAYRSKDHEVVQGRLSEVLKACQGEILSDRIANHEWEERSKLMVVKRLGPSLVPAELVVPLKALGDVMEEIDRKIAQPVVKEGIVIRESSNGESEVVILGFIPSDQRTFSYNLVFSLVMTVMKIAENHGGRPYSTGLYFKGEAAKVMGKNRMNRLKTFKKQIDPQGLLNPGKVIGHGLISSVMSLAQQGHHSRRREAGEISAGHSCGRCLVCL